jgi:hypothetical protein
MVVQGFGDKDFYQIGVILAANGHCFEHMRYCVYGDTGSGGIKVPLG